MRERTRFTARMHNLKEQLQHVAEMELSAAREALHQAETSAIRMHERWQSALGGPVNETVSELQYRADYASILRRQLEHQRETALAASKTVSHRVEALKWANVANEQWAHLSNEAKAQRLQELEHRGQNEADDLASGRFATRQKGAHA
jgi:flagellar biosynthesis chaperone FliJ